MSHNGGQTIVKYQGTALPLNASVNTLFDSTVLGFGTKCFFLLGQKWFSYAVKLTSAASATITGEWSNDGFVTTNTFYSKTILTATDVEDEVFVGQLADVRFRLTAGADITALSLNLLLSPDKPTSKSPANSVMVDG